MASARYEDIHSSHKQMALRLTQINSENALAEKLQRQLEHEKIVLEERKAVSDKAMIMTVTIANYK